MDALRRRKEKKDISLSNCESSTIYFTLQPPKSSLQQELGGFLLKSKNKTIYLKRVYSSISLYLRQPREFIWYLLLPHGRFQRWRFIYRRMSERLKEVVSKTIRDIPHVGSNPTPSAKYGKVPEWLKGTDCKSVGICLRGFESLPSHKQV